MSERKPLYTSPGEKGKSGFEVLECYQLALEVMARIHTFSKALPPDEKFDLYAQIRRSAKGITGNIGEGYVRRQRTGSREFGEEAVHEEQADYNFSQYEDHTEQESGI